MLTACPNPTDLDSSNLNLEVYKTGSRAGLIDKSVIAGTRSIVSSFAIGSSRQSVFDTLGDPDAIFYGNTSYTPGEDYEADAYYVYNDIGLSFRIFGDSVKKITLLPVSGWLLMVLLLV